MSGWTYAPWRGQFYPDGLPQKRELAFASRTFNSIEINGTFYGLQKPDMFARWADETPEGFVFAVKGPRFITHMKRLREGLWPTSSPPACRMTGPGRRDRRPQPRNDAGAASLSPMLQQ